MQSDGDAAKQRKFSRIIIAYPFALIIGGLGLNLLVIGVQPASPNLPTLTHLMALTTSVLLLLANHIWLMTSTELTRLRHRLYATPEEWAASGLNETDASEIGISELNRRHNAHANATENTVYFALLLVPFLLISPSATATWVWLVSFSIGRLGHAWAYLHGKDNLRGLFMSLSLTALFGLASYLKIALLAAL